MELAKQGAIREAMATFAAAQANDPDMKIAAAAWNTLCWFGSLGGFATDVIAACERGVTLEPDHGGIRDSRGVARALTGDYSGAIQDFQQFLEWGPKEGVPEEEISSTSSLDPNVANKPESVQRRTIETLMEAVGYWGIRVGVLFLQMETGDFGAQHFPWRR